MGYYKEELTGRMNEQDIIDPIAFLAREAALMGGNEDGLLLLADRQGLTTEVPGGVCTPVRGRSSVALADR